MLRRAPGLFNVAAVLKLLLIFAKGLRSFTALGSGNFTAGDRQPSEALLCVLPLTDALT